MLQWSPMIIAFSGWKMDIRPIIGSPDFSSPNPSSLDSFRTLLLGKTYANGLGALVSLCKICQGFNLEHILNILKPLDSL
jgi:hypothetical protein